LSPKRVPTGGGAHPRGDFTEYIRILPETYNHLACQAQASGDKPELAIAMSRLIQIHEVHVYGRPWQIAIELRVQVQKWLAQ
jgi:hypothetical protein